jgi:hypothetical protein
MAKGKVQEPPSAEKSDQAAEEAVNVGEKKINTEYAKGEAPEQAQQVEDEADAAGSQAEPDEQSEGFVTGEIRRNV